MKTYIKSDKLGNFIPGSVVARESMPQNGNWQEIPKKECCNFLQTPVVVDISTFPLPLPFAALRLSIYTGTGTTMQITRSSEQAAAVTTTEELATLFNNTIGDLGTFTFSSTDVWITPNAEIAKIFANAKALTLIALAFND
jgi:hypothetical protein